MKSERKRAARFGPKWWDRNGHISFYRPETGWLTYSSTGSGEHDGFEWPRPCAECNAITLAWHYGT